MKNKLFPIVSVLSLIISVAVLVLCIVIVQYQNKSEENSKYTDQHLSDIERKLDSINPPDTSSPTLDYTKVPH